MTERSGRGALLLAALALGAISLASEWLPGVAGQFALYPLLGAFPGLALAWVLLPRASTTTRSITGLVLAPVVSSIVGWVLLSAGLHPAVATRAIGWLGWLLWTLQLVRAGAPADGTLGEETPSSGALWGVSLALAAAIALPHFLNPWMLVKSDAWYHAGLVYQILERGMPPEDPRFAGLPINYVWFFNLFIGLLSSVHDGDPFVFMTTLNVVDVALIAWLAYLTGWMLWRSRDGAIGTALLTCFGFNALAWLTWPLRGISGIPAFLRGAGPLHYALPPLRPRSWMIMSDLGAPHTFNENFVDKFVTGTSINYTWLLMMLWLWAMVRLMRGPHPGVTAIAVLCAAGMLLWHGVVGLSVIPVAGCALLLTLLLRSRLRWLPGPARLIDCGLATAAGFLIALPYTISISRGWDARQTGMHVSPFHLNPEMTLTILTSCAFALAFAWRPMLEALSERRADAAPLLIYAAGMAAFSILIALPDWNETKFAFEAFIPLALFGGASFFRWSRGLRSRWGAAGTSALSVALALPLVLTLVGFTCDPARWGDAALNPAPGETQLYAWIRDRTPQNMVFVDHRFRDLIMVRARRQLYLGSSSGPERAAFPLKQVIERRAVMSDLYGPARDLAGDAAALAGLGRPACVVYRSQDAASGADPGAAASARPDLFERIYDRDGFVLYALPMSMRADPSRGVRP